jgi:hypothetical protein
VTVIDVSPVTALIVAGMVPKSTVLAPVNPDPVMVAVAPPVVKPVAGLTSLTTGVAAAPLGWKASQRWT